MKKFAKKHLFTLIGAFIGAIAGYLYWKFIGCTTGSCVITSNPFNGAVMGGLLVSTLKKEEDVSGNNQQ